MLRRTFIAGCATTSLLRAQNDNAKMFADAQAYERFMGRWSRQVAPLLTGFAAVPAQGRVLDVGSGAGALAFALAERNTGIKVVGIDPSEGYVAYAKSTNPYPARVSFQLGDAQDLHFPSGFFRASVALLVMNFIPDPRKALNELRRVTEPGGVIAAAVWDYGGSMRMLRAFWDAAVSMDPKAGRLDEKHMPLSREGELSQLWKEAGLQNVREQPLDLDLRFASFADYWDPFLLGQGPAGSYVRALDAGRARALRDAMKQQLSISAESSPLTLPARVWAVRGTVPMHP